MHRMQTVTSNALLVVFLLILAAPSFAQSRSTLRVTVVDQTGASIVGAALRVTPAAEAGRDVVSDARGQATFVSLAQGAVQIHVEAPGFAPYDANVTLRRGNNNHTATLRLATLEEQLVVTDRDAADRRGNSFSTTLDEQDLEGLPDDPQDFEDALRQMAGGEAVFNVNGFRGGRLPPKNQIRQVRFRMNSFAAENHEAGMVHVDIITKPGMTAWTGNANIGFRDEVMNARNAFASSDAPEQFRRFMGSLSGPLRKDTTLTINVEGNDSYDSRTIVAQTADGRIGDQVRRPVQTALFTASLEQALTKTQTLRVEYQRRDEERRNLGVGDFDLAERAYTRTSAEHQVRASATSIIGKTALNELRAQFRVEDSASNAISDDPAVIVIDSFNSGGAGVSNARALKSFELTNNTDFTAGRHAMRAGLLFQAGAYRQFDARNASGTFVFGSLDAFAAGRPNTFTERLGDVETSFTQYQLGVFWQDDLRVTKNLSLSVGVREEVQSHVGDALNMMPRVGFTWNPLGGKTAIRGGYGLFHDWFGADLYDQSLRVNGIAQRDLLVLNPGYPDPFASAAAVALPGGRVEIDPGLSMPNVHQSSIGVERTFRELLTLQASYMRNRGYNQLRSRNVNAPDASGVRPFPGEGTIARIESSGRSELDRLLVNASFRVPQRRFMFGIHYILSSRENHTDNPLALPADSRDPDVEWGPSAQDARHVLFTMLSVGLPKRFRANVMSQATSALPYTITTGRDDNGDGVSNDRPAGIGRNAARGSARWDLNVRLSRGFGFGGERRGEPGSGPTIARRAGGGDEGGPVMMTLEQSNDRYRVDFYVQGYNILNRTNYLTYSGNLQSPFFGLPSAAGPARRVELGMQFVF
jgi:hypothetical protein